MAVSNSYDFNMTASQVVKDAMTKLGVLQDSEEPAASEMVDGLRALTLMIKTLQAQTNLWRYAEATLFLTIGTESYTLAGSSSDRCVSTFTQTTTSADASETDLTVDLTSVTGVDDTYVIGVQYSSTAIHWTTVNGTPVGSTVTLTDALPADVDSGSTVYVYQTSSLIVRPLRIKQIRRRNSSIDTPIFKVSRSDYFLLPNKSSQTTPTQWYYDPGRDSGTLYIWGTGSTVNDTLKITYLRPLMDVDAQADNLDVPQEWLLPIIYNLAVILAPDHGITPTPDVLAIAQSLDELVEGWDHEDSSVYFHPEYR